MRLLPLLAARAGLVSVAAHADDIEDRLRSGDDPWRITQQRLAGPASWPRLLRHNRLSEAEARRLPVGSVLRIPSEWLARREAELTVLAVHREVSLQRGAERAAARVGDRLRTGDVLRTGEGAAATVRVEDGSRVLLRPDSEVAVEQAERSNTGTSGILRLRLQLLRGALENIVQPVAPGGRFEIRTPSGIGAVRGTEYRVTADDQRTASEVLEGRVQLTGGSAKGPAVAIAAGQGSVVERGQAPLPPVTLLPAPDLSSLPAVAERLPIDLAIAAVPGAAGYRTQMAADEAFTQLLSDVVTQAPRLRVPDVEDGERYVRVRAIDPQGLEGRSGQRPLRVHARPEAPLLLEPAPAGQVPQPQPVFRWTQATVPGRQVRLQLARDAAFRESLLDERLPDRSEWRVPNDLPPGRYHWRIAAIDAALGEGPWGDAQSFERVLVPPDVQLPSTGQLPMVLRWQRLPGAQRYRVRLLQAGEVRQVHTLTAEQWVLEALAPGAYDVQVQALAEDAQEGPWSTPQRFTVPASGGDWPWWLLFLVPFWWV